MPIDGFTALSARYLDVVSEEIDLEYFWMMIEEISGLV